MVPGAIIQFTPTFGLHLYGLFIGLGIVLCLVLFFVYTKRMGMKTEVQDFVFYVAIGAIAIGFLFAKLYQAVYDYIENPSAGFDFMGAGITVMGGLIGGAGAFLALYFGVGHFLYKKKDNIHIKSFNRVFLTAPICITIAHGFGRIGCLMGGCCHGAYLGTEYVVGGIWMAGNKGWGFYVPTQLYEALFLFALAAVLSVLYFKRSNLIMPIYLIAYGVWRFLIEFLRADYRGAMVFQLSPSQWQSFVFVGAGIAIILFYFFKKIPFVLPKEQVDGDKSQDESEILDITDSDQKENQAIDDVDTDEKDNGTQPELTNEKGNE